MVEKNAFLFDLDYYMEEGEPVVRLFCKSPDKENIVSLVKGFYPYFYVIPEEDSKNELMEEISNLEFENNGEVIKVLKVKKISRTEGNKDIEVLKVFAYNPKHIPKLKDEVKGWDSVEDKREFDIPFYKRFLIDKDIRPFSLIHLEGNRSPNQWDSDICLSEAEIRKVNREGKPEFNTMAFDLETYRGEIIMLSLFSSDLKRVYTRRDFENSQNFLKALGSEEKIIEKFIAVIKEQDVDILFGYNSDDFDFDILRKRAEKYDIDLRLGRDNSRMIFVRRGRSSSSRIKGRIHLDLYRFVDGILGRSMESETLSLNNVSEELVGEKKEDMSWEDIKKSWKERRNLQKLVKYSLRDSEITFKLGKYLFPQIYSLSRLVGQNSFDVIRSSYGQLVENYLIRESFKRNILVPNRPKRSTIGERRSEDPFTGGFVFEPEEGLYENIGLLDFRSLYPSIILSYNISPETLNVEGCKEESEVEIKGETYRFCQEKRGFITEILEKLIEERYELKKKLKTIDEDSEEYRETYSRQYALKILANSFYGYLGYAGARWYSRPCAESTTALGREYIHKTIREAEKRGLKVIYGDTDSVFLEGDNIRKNVEKFQREINEELPEFMELELEKIYERGLFTSTKSGKGAKKRYALKDEEGNLKITGFERVRRDWSVLAKETQGEVIDRVLDNEVEEADSILQRIILDLKRGEIPLEKLVIYTKLTKKPENYETTSPHVEAAKKAIQRGLNIKPGDTVGYVITKGHGSISERAELLKFAENYDPDYYIENQIIPAAMRILKIFDYSREDFLMKGRQSGLGKFT